MLCGIVGLGVFGIVGVSKEEKGMDSLGFGVLLVMFFVGFGVFRFITEVAVVVIELRR